jgi:tetratricopeptide (TPR) repeat protein
MLSEEALILVVIAGASVLIVLGVLELVWPTGPRHPVRRPQVRPPAPKPVEPPARPRLPLSIAPSRPPAELVFRRPPGYLGPSPLTEVAAPPEPAKPPEAIAPVETTAPAEASVPVAPAVVPETPPPPQLIRPFEPTRSLERPEPRPTEFSTPPAEVPAPPPVEHPAPPAPAEPAEPLRRRRSKISPHARPHRVLRPSEASADRAIEPAPGTVVPLDSVRPAPVQPAASPTVPAPEAKPKRDTPLVEACFAMYQEKRFGEVVSIAEETLAKQGVRWPATTSHETAALWSVVGLAKQALGDADGARVALESAVDASPEAERSTYRHHLAALALDAAQARLARVGSLDAGDRVPTIREAIAWTERGLTAVASDPELDSTREAAHEALWQAYEHAATALLQRQEFGAARQLLREALEDPALPAVRAAGFRGMLSSTFGAEVGQLTAQAILSMQEDRESEALDSLKRAETVLAAIPTEALPPTRRDEVDQRLWWGYAELGSRRLEAGDYEEALDPLIHALRFESIGAERQAETRAAIVRTLEGIAAMRAMSIRRLADAGCRDEAGAGAEELRALLRNCVDLGITEGELWAAYTRIQRLCEELNLEERA